MSTYMIDVHTPLQKSEYTVMPNGDCGYLIMKFSHPIQPHHFAVKDSIRHQNNMK